MQVGCCLMLQCMGDAAAAFVDVLLMTTDLSRQSASAQVDSLHSDTTVLSHELVALTSHCVIRLVR